MKSKSINACLIAAILSLSLIPLTASYFLINEVLESAIQLSLNPKIEILLKEYRQDLKQLRDFDPQHEDSYKNRFVAIGDELIVYDNPDIMHNVLWNTYRTYYFIIFLCVLAITAMAAIMLTRKVSRSYKRLADKELQQATRLQELNHFDEWQNIARKLAHEIKNPLTPIEMMVSNLPRSFNKLDNDAFEDALNNTHEVVTQEVHKLKDMVNHFANFSKLAEPHFESINFDTYLTQFIQQYEMSWPSLDIAIKTTNKPSNNVALDPLLFNQVLINLLNNAVEANKTRSSIAVVMALTADENIIILSIHNEGTPIPLEMTTKVFKMHYSTKHAPGNMGLGLSIVKKIILDHNGSIECLPVTEGATFKIQLPFINNNENE